MDISKKVRVVSALDHAVGQIERIIDAGIWNQTVMGLLDGQRWSLKSANNFPLRGQSTAWEGGGVAFVRGTRDETMERTSVSPGTVSTELMHATDWYPTFETIRRRRRARWRRASTALDGVSQWNGSLATPTTRTMIVHNCPAPGGDRGGAIRVGRHSVRR